MWRKKWLCVHGTEWQFPVNLYEYLFDLFHGMREDVNENIKIRQGGKGRSYYLRLLSKDGQPNAVQFKNFFRQVSSSNAFFHPNTFVPCGKRSGCARFSNLYHVYAFAIDVDYSNHRPHNRKADFLGAMSPEMYADALLQNCLEEEGLPWPNYIEYSHNIRLIYILDEPLYVRNEIGQDILKKLTRFQKHIAYKINAWDTYASAMAQSVSLGFRIPGSTNTKGGRVVQVKKVYSNFYSFGELFDYLADIPVVTKKHKKHGKRSASTIQRLERLGMSNWIAVRTVAGMCAPKDGWPEIDDKMPSYLKAMLLKRLCALRSGRDIASYRELTTFCYLTTYATLFGFPEGIMPVAMEFNDGFAVPLPTSEIRRKFQKVKLYKLTDKTIADLTGIPLNFVKIGGMEMLVHLEETKPRLSPSKQRKYTLNTEELAKKRKEKKQKKGRKRKGKDEAFAELFQQFCDPHCGMRCNMEAIMQKMHCSKRTAYRRWNEWKQKQSVQPIEEKSSTKDAIEAIVTGKNALDIAQKEEQTHTETFTASVPVSSPARDKAIREIGQIPLWGNVTWVCGPAEKPREPDGLRYARPCKENEYLIG